MTYNLFESLSWATRILPAAVYMLEWNGKKYVGSSVSLASRLYWWRRENLPADTTVTLLEQCTVNDRLRLEENWIAKLNTLAPNGHNKTVSGQAGGVFGREVTEKTKQRISDSNTGKRRTDEHKKTMSEAAKKRGAHPPEVYAKISAKMRGRKLSESAKKAVSEKLTGKPKSEAHRAALKEAWKRRKEAQCQPK